MAPAMESRGCATATMAVLCGDMTVLTVPVPVTEGRVLGLLLSSSDSAQP